MNNRHDDTIDRQAPPTRSNVLRRSRRDRWLAGVLGGLAHYLGLEPLLLRIVWFGVVFLVDPFVAFLLYVVGWIAIPQQGRGEQLTTAGTTRSGRWVVGLGLIVLGGAMLAEPYLPRLNTQVLVPSLLIVTGALVLSKGLRR